jgi:hypothetical protein
VLVTIKDISRLKQRIKAQHYLKYTCILIYNFHIIVWFQLKSVTDLFDICGVPLEPSAHFEDNFFWYPIKYDLS